jgi:hypothetical protein
MGPGTDQMEASAVKLKQATTARIVQMLAILSLTTAGLFTEVIEVRSYFPEHEKLFSGLGASEIYVFDSHVNTSTRRPTTYTRAHSMSNNVTTQRFMTNSKNHTSNFNGSSLVRGKRDEEEHQVVFMSIKDFLDIDQAYSGVWWQHVSNFMKYNPYTLTNLEGASFAPWYEVGFNHVKMALDWLDFAVEHLSHYHKLLLEEGFDSALYNGMMLRMQNYIQAHEVHDESPPTTNGLAPSRTIALLPFMTWPEKIHSPSAQLSIWSLAATVVSLMQIHVKRILVVCRSELDLKLVHKVFENIISPFSELAVVLSNANLTGVETQGKLMPKQAMIGLQMALTKNMSQALQQDWLGDSDNFDYIYYSEPDLILNIRPSAIPAITAIMDGGNIMAAHRMQPLPHVDDFPNHTTPQRLAPAVDNFSANNILKVDPDQIRCCDAGNHYPALEIEDPCSSFRWQCGFYKRGVNYMNSQEAYQAHHLLHPYSLMRLEMNQVTLAGSEHNRMCILQEKPCIMLPELIKKR